MTCIKLPTKTFAAEISSHNYARNRLLTEFSDHIYIYKRSAQGEGILAFRFRP